MFTPSQGWNFIGWEVIDRNTEELVKDVIKLETPEKLETKGKVLNPTENIAIRAKCVQVPVIKEIYPSYAPSGDDQDKTIRVVFNKPVNPSSFGDFSCITITSANGNLFSNIESQSYFETPFFSDDKTVLYIQPIKGKFILPIDEENVPDIADINFYIDFSSIKDCDGFAFEQMSPYTYRINKNVDQIKPEIKSIHLFSTDNQDDKFYRELSKKAFENWTTTVTPLNEITDYFGVYNQNHVSKFFIDVTGYDEQSGVSQLVVKETYIKKMNDGSYSSVTPLQSNPVQRFDISSGNNSENNTSSAFIEYNFYDDEVDAGVYKIEITVEDFSKNESEIETYYVIKDKVPRVNEETIKFTSTTPLQKEELYIPVHDSTLNADVVGLEFKELMISMPNIYNNSLFMQSIVSIEISEEKQSPVVLFEDYYSKRNQLTTTIGRVKNLTSEINDALNQYKRNVNKETTIKLTVKQEHGITSTFEYVIPAARDVVYAGQDSFYVADREIQRGFSGTHNDYTAYIKYKPFEGELSSINYFLSGSNYNIKTGGDGIYYIYVTNKKGLSAAFGKPYVYYKGGTNNTNLNDVPFPNISVPDFSDTTKVTYKQNSGIATFDLIVDYLSTDDYYFVIRTDRLAGHWFNYFNTKTISVSNADDICSTRISLLAYTKDGKYIGESAVFTDAGTYSLDENSKYIDVRPNVVDNISPGIASDNSPRYISSDGIRYPALPKDTKANGNSVTSNISYPVKCYIVPASWGKNLTYEQLCKGSFKCVELTEEDIVVENNSSGYCNISLVGLEEGVYYLYFYLVDNSTLKNYSLNVIETEMLYKFVDKSLIPDALSSTSEKLIIKTPNAKMSSHINLQFFKDGKWNECSAFINENKKFLNQDMTRVLKDNIYLYIYENEYTNLTDCQGTFVKVNTCSSSTVKNNNYFCPIYIYPDYYRLKGTADEITCENTGWMTIDNGRQIFCDSPVFVHTIYSQSMLTETNNVEDAHVWEARGYETGIVTTDGKKQMFTYSNDNLSQIPKGYWYTTIAHFVDGTILMSPVKQK